MKQRIFLYIFIVFNICGYSQMLDAEITKDSSANYLNFVTIQDFSAQELEQQLLGYLQQAKLSMENADFPQALQFNDQAIALGQYLNIPEYAWRQFQQRGEILQAMGELDQALPYYRLAIEHSARIQAQLKRDEFELLIEFQRARINYVKLLLADTHSNLENHTEQKFLKDSDEETTIREQRKLTEVLKVWEGLKQGQLTEYLGRACVIPNQSIEQLMLHNPHSAIIYPIVYDNQMEILLVIEKTIYRIKIDQAYRRIAKLSQRLNRAISRLRPEYSRYSKALYQILFSPIQPLLAEKGVTTLVWVQDSSLMGLPIAALQNKAGRFLIQDYALALSPGLDLLSGGFKKPLADKLFLVGMAQATDYQQEHFPALPGVTRELDKLSHLFPNHLLKRGDFEWEKLIRQLQVEEFDIIHIASHSQIGADIQDSFLLAPESAISFSALADVIAARRFANYPLELLTLSACQTAVGNTDTSLGLAGLLVNTGARSVLASLWKVDDQASAKLMQGFYQYWGKTQGQQQSKAKALQQVQREMINSDYQHPFYWSGFILIGHWD